MKNATLSDKQLKAMGKVIEKFGGSKKIKAMPLKDRLTVAKEIELARRGLPNGPVKLFIPDDKLVFWGDEFAAHEEHLKIFDQIVKKLEIWTETETKASKDSTRGRVKMYVGTIISAAGVGSALLTFYMGNPTLLTVGIAAAAVAVGGAVLAWGTKDCLNALKVLTQGKEQISNVA